MKSEWVTHESLCENIDEVRRIFHWQFTQPKNRSRRCVLFAKGYDTEECFQIAIADMLQDSLKSSKRMSLAHYVCNWAFWSIGIMLQSSRRMCRHGSSRNEPLHDDHTISHDFERVDNREFYESIIQHLKWRDAIVLKGRLFGEVTLAKIGEKLGVTKERVRQIEARVLRSLEKLPEVEQVLGFED